MPQLVRIDFDPNNFRNLVNTRGYEMRWEKYLTCPCRNPTTRQPAVNCPICHGKGALYEDPKPIRGLVTSGEVTTDLFRPPGMWERGTCYVTVGGENKISFFDRLTLLDTELSFVEILTRAASGADRLIYPALAAEFLYGVTRDGAGNITATMTYPTTSVAIDADGNLTWVADQPQPAAGATYAARYTMRPQYIVMDIPHAFRYALIKTKYGTETPKVLPRMATCQLDFLIQERS